jgi:hypothetical protein
MDPTYERDGITHELELVDGWLVVVGADGHPA